RGGGVRARRPCRGSRAGAAHGRSGAASGSGGVQPRAPRRAGGGGVPRGRRAPAGARMRVLQIVSCRGWSSDAYWAARISVELERAGHQVVFACRRGTESRVIDRARAAGVRRIEMLELPGGVRPAADAADVRRLRRWLADVDVVHTHRGKEHWLAALANRLSLAPRPLVRTRHIVQPVRPHPLNRQLYRKATALVVTVTEAIRRQYLAAGLVEADRVVALPGGVDAEAWQPGRSPRPLRAALGVADGVPVVGLLGGFRVVKGPP